LSLCKIANVLLCGFFLVAGWPASIARGANAEPPQWTVEVEFSPQVRQEPFSGRVYLFFSEQMDAPRLGPNWFQPEPFLAREVKDWKPGEVLTFSNALLDKTLVYPRELAKLDLTGDRVQAVARFNPLDRNVGTGAGNGFSSVQTIPSNPAPANPAPANTPVRLVIDQTVPEREFHETRWAKELAVRSKLLSDFHKRDVELKAAVLLPASYYEQPQRRYPVIFQIPGFGGTHLMGSSGQPVQENNQDGVEFLRVMLDPSCPLGHHVFADSANNGPVGEALIKEIIPALDKQYRTIPEPSARFLTGHSSGGWSSLWLQVAYPDFFGGVWSTAPDPVDFRDFQRINLYQPGENMYQDAEGKPRPLARGGGLVTIWYRDFDHMETVLGPGGQLHSFEAAFSPRGANGKPVRVWNRETGEIDTAAAKNWEKYDIRLILERNWKTLGPKLQGKLHVFMGDQDTFYLDGATKLLKQSLEKLPGDAVVEIHAGKNHGSLMTAQLRDRIRQEMTEAFLKLHKP
jgi:Putative esterase